MSASVSAYTTLESLLLFQSLHAYGVAPAVFGKISDLLKKNPDITEDGHYEPSRLSPDAIRSFYVTRLRREVEVEQGGESAENGDGANPRKRKVASPKPNTVQELLQHQHLIPRLVEKLYATYRNELTELIRAEEARYDRLQRDVQSIERGEWDEQLKERAAAKTQASQSPGLSRTSPHLAQKPALAADSQQLGVQSGARGSPSGNANAPAPEGPPLEALKPLPPQAGPPSADSTPNPSSRKKRTTAGQRHTPSTPQSIAASPSLQQPFVPPPGYQQYPQPPGAGYNGPPYHHLSPHPHGPQNLPPPPGSSHPPHASSPVAGHPPAPFPHQPIQPYGGNGAPHYGPPNPGPPPAYAPIHRLPHPQGSGAQSPGVQTPQRTYFPHPGQPQHQALPPPPQAGFMLPPFQVSPQDPSRVHHQPAVPPPHSQTSTPVNNRQQASASRTHVQTPGAYRPGVPPMHPLITQARQSFSTPTNSRSPLSAFGTPVSAKSQWKRQNIVGTPITPRPEVEPVDDFVPLTMSQQSFLKAKPRKPRRGRGRGKDAENEAEEIHVQDSGSAPATPHIVEHLEEPTTETTTRQGRSRRKAATKRARPGSIASSRAGGSVRDRSRSQSILSHTETVAADNESQAENTIKSERGTSVDAMDEEPVQTPQMTTRRRAGAAQAASTRRKRNAREASLEEADDRISTPGPPRTIIAPRRFSHMSNPIMNDIGSHRHASTFDSAVKAKDAPDYYKIVKRPTDLGTIRQQIKAGAKQVAAAASDTPVGSPGGAGGVVELSMTKSNVPPQAIVNSSQLEKELMRMFVNAVMFNPGEEGVVADARQMFETVQQSVSNWRNVERSSGRTEVEDTPGPGDEDVPAASKRRKV